MSDRRQFILGWVEAAWMAAGQNASLPHPGGSDRGVAPAPSYVGHVG